MGSSQVNRGKIIIKIFSLFLFVYEFQLISVPDVLSSRRIILLLVLLYLALINKHIFIKLETLRLTISFLIFAIYAFLMYLINGGTGESVVGSLIYFSLYAILAPYFISELFNSIDEFMIAFSAIGVVQAVIIFCQYFISRFRSFLNEYIKVSGNVSYLRIDRATGIGAEGATLGFFLGISMLSCVYLVYKTKKNTGYIVQFVIILIASALVSRTGLAIGVALSLVMLLRLLKNGASNIIKVLVSLIPITYGLMYIFQKYITDSRLNYMSRWLKNIFDTNEGSTIHALSNMEIPKLSLETIMGTGIRRGVLTSGVIVQNDIGYIQLYVALGLVVSILFYISISKIILSRIKSVHDKALRYILIILFMMSIILEFKEPFFLKYIAVFFIMTCAEIDLRNLEE